MMIIRQARNIDKVAEVSRQIAALSKDTKVLMVSSKFERFTTGKPKWFVSEKDKPFSLERVLREQENSIYTTPLQDEAMDQALEGYYPEWEQKDE